MLKILGAAAVLSLAILPAGAQTTNAPSSSSQMAPSGQNSGTGVQGLPGSKSGPTVKSDRQGGMSGGATSGSSQQNSTVQQQDSSKIPGAPGNKSGPPARANSDMPK